VLHKMETNFDHLNRLVLSPEDLRRLKSTFDCLWEGISFAFPNANSEWTRNARESLAGAILTIFQENRKTGNIASARSRQTRIR
jgi:hypothetical protein